MNTAMIIPTGIGCDIGGHAGDANAAAKLIASVSDNLIIHPNVVNASDINEMSENMWYVEGSILDEFFKGRVSLKKPKSNKILLAANPPLKNEIINSVNAAKKTVGAEIEIFVLENPLRMEGYISNEGKAEGKIEGANNLIEEIREYKRSNRVDALAINTEIDVNKDTAMRYITEGGVNPWGGIEAIASKYIAQKLIMPVAHSPSGHTIDPDYNEIVDPRMAAEMVSVSYLHCILKGLHKAPHPIIGEMWNKNNLSIEDLDCLVIPSGCSGIPDQQCRFRGIPVIEVMENKIDPIVACNQQEYKDYNKNNVKVGNYHEAAGIIQALKIGVSFDSIRNVNRDPVLINEVI